MPGIRSVTPERKAADVLKLDKKASRKLRELGFTSALVVPGRGIFRGASALVDLQEADANTLVVSPLVAQHVAFDFASAGRDGGYPASLMGCIALIRQTLLDGAWYQAAQDAYREKPDDDGTPGGEREPGSAGGLCAAQTAGRLRSGR